MKKIIATLVIALCVVGSAMAQDELSFERKQAIDSLALEPDAPQLRPRRD